MTALPSRFDPTGYDTEEYASSDYGPGDFDDMTEYAIVIDLAKLVAGLPIEECRISFDERAPQA